MSIPRLMTAMITPYDHELEVDYDRAAELAAYLCDHGSQGLVVCGTTGESPVLNHDEKLKLFSTVVEAVGKRVPVWAGTGSNDTAASASLSREAEKLGVAGIMLVAPYYNKPSQAGLYKHFKTIADSISLPVMVYNIPGRTSINILPETVAKLAAIDNITAIKEASGSMDQVSGIMSLVPPDFLVYSGDDSLTLPMMALGAVGVVSIASHLVGDEMKAMVEAFAGGNAEQAREIHTKLFPLIRTLFIATNPVPLKEAMNIMGNKVGGLRPPLVEADERERGMIRKMLQDYGLLD